MTNSKNILIIEDDPVIAEDIAFYAEEFGYTVCGKAYNDKDALIMLAEGNADFVFLDIELNCERNGIDIAKIINSEFFIPFAFITSFTDNKTLALVKDTYPVGYLVKPFNEKEIKTTIEIGYNTYYSKFLPSIALDFVSINKKIATPFTEKEIEILLKLNEGKSNKQLAEELFVSLNTVKTHLKNIFVKLNAGTRAEALVLLKQLASF